jgi:PadR family transcriptional regulator PadR
VQPTDRLQGTLDLLILRVLQQGTQHGWGIAQHIQQISLDVLQVNQGSLYPALRRLEERGWISAEWGTSENNRRARFYELTRDGKKQLADETASWEEFVLAVSRVLQPQSSAAPRGAV